MPINHHFFNEHRLVLIEHQGLITDSEYHISYERLFDNPEFADDLAVLVDLRATNSSPRSTDSLQTMAGRLLKHDGRPERARKIVIVAPSDLSFGLSRVFEAHLERDLADVEVVRDFDEALKHLGLTSLPPLEC